MPDPAPNRSEIRPSPLARAAISAAFILYGGAIGLWFVHVPVVATRLHLESAVLGMALLMVGLTGLLCQPLAALAIARFGSRQTAMVLLPLMVASILLPILSPSVPFLFAALITVGLFALPTNVALNTQAAEFEVRRGRPVMSSFHGCFSLGGMIAAALGGVLIARGYGDGRGAAGFCLFVVPAAVLATNRFLDAPPPPRTARHRLFAIPARALAGFAMIALLANVVEGSVGDWSALYLATVKNSGPGLAASSYTMFAFAMAAFRLFGAPVVERLGDRNIIAGGGLLMALGMATVILAPWPLISALGFLVVALGAANIAPILMSVAARTPGIAPSIGIAAISSGLIIGLLSGPPLIGLIAQAWGLSAGLGVTALIGGYICIAAWSRKWHPDAKVD